jgi:hypothetical protein
MSYRITNTFLLALLTFAAGAYEVRAAQLQLLLPTTVYGKATLNGQLQSQQFTIPTVTSNYSNGLRAYKSAPNLSLASSEATASFNNGWNSLTMRLSTDAHATSASPRALAEVSTVNTSSGYLPVYLRPESWAGESNGQRVLVTLMASYSGSGNSTANGGYNWANVLYVPGTSGSAYSLLYANGANATISRSTNFYATMGSYFWIKPQVTSWAPAALNNFKASLNLNVQIQRVSSYSLSAVSVPEPASMLGMVLSAAPATAFLRRRRLR